MASLQDNMLHAASQDGSDLFLDGDIQSTTTCTDGDEDPIPVTDMPTLNDIDVPLVKPKRGREANEVWICFTDDAHPSRLKSAICKHCKVRINHHKKNEYAKTHLNKCKPFIKFMNGMEQTDCPDWYVGMKKKQKFNTVASSPSSLSSSHQTSMSQFALPKLTPRQKVEFQMHIAMHYYATATSFQHIEDPHLIRAIKLLHPNDDLLPNRKQLAGTLLDKCYKEISVKVAKKLMNHTFCLTTDGWSNIKNDAVINYMAVSPSCSLFLESVSTGAQGHDHQFIADDITRVINKHPSTVFAGAVTDNTSTNKKAWTLLHDRFPSCYFQGCCSHGLHLFVKDIFGATKTKKTGNTEPTYPVGYPFDTLLEFVSDCKDIVKLFLNHHVEKSQLQELQKTTKAPALARPAATRWGTIQRMCKSLLESEKHLHTLSNARDFVKGTAAKRAERQKIKDVIANNEFVANLQRAIAILAPLDRLIVKYQSDKVPISEVMPDFKALPKEFNNLLNSQIITQCEYEYLVMIAHTRFRFMYGTAHGLSYILDPRYVDDLPDNHKELEAALIKTPIDNVIPLSDDRKETLYRQYKQFQISATEDKANNAYNYEMLLKDKTSVLEYWLTDGKLWPELQLIAIKLFTMATSSAASERNFSTMGFVHSKLRNSLSVETVEKLVFVKTNGPVFYATKLVVDDDDDDESECDSSIDSSSDE